MLRRLTLALFALFAGCSESTALSLDCNERGASIEAQPGIPVVMVCSGDTCGSTAWTMDGDRLVVACRGGQAVEVAWIR